MAKFSCYTSKAQSIQTAVQYNTEVLQKKEKKTNTF